MPSDVDHVDGHFHLFTIRLAGLLAARLAISRCAEGKAEGLMNRSVIQVNKQVCVACQPEEISQRWPEMRNVSADKCAQKPLLLQMARGRVGSKQQDGLHLSAVGNVPPPPSPSSEQKREISGHKAKNGTTASCPETFSPALEPREESSLCPINLSSALGRSGRIAAAAEVSFLSVDPSAGPRWEAWVSSFLFF